jgi:hypothetical protein
MLATEMDTTAHALTQAISMAKYPEWLENIWEEQQSIITTKQTGINCQVESTFPISHFLDAWTCLLRVLNGELYDPVKCRQSHRSQLV